MAVYILVIIAAIIIVFIFLYFYKIEKPLKKIIKACEEVRKGNLDVKIDIKSKTKIGELIKTFNEMIKDLKRSHVALEESKDVLEIKVRARTRELRELLEQRERIIEERTGSLQERIKELERFSRLVVGRELKMIELKKEIKRLK